MFAKLVHVITINAYIILIQDILIYNQTSTLFLFLFISSSPSSLSILSLSSTLKKTASHGMYSVRIKTVTEKQNLEQVQYFNYLGS